MKKVCEGEIPTAILGATARRKGSAPARFAVDPPEYCRGASTVVDVQLSKAPPPLKSLYLLVAGSASTMREESPGQFLAIQRTPFSSALTATPLKLKDIAFMSKMGKRLEKNWKRTMPGCRIETRTIGSWVFGTSQTP